MLEAGWERLVDETWLVIASESVAKARLMNRNKFSEEEALKRIHSVPSAAERMLKVCYLDTAPPFPRPCCPPTPAVRA